MSIIRDRDGDGKVLHLRVGDAWADVALFGSTVIGWHPAGATQSNSKTGADESLIFLSKETKPGKAFRGGIPIVFPVFGEVKDHENVPKLLENAPRHGFCRDRLWKLTKRESEEKSRAIVTMTLSSDDEPALLEKFPCPFAINHAVTLTENSLECTLRIEHLSSSQNETMPFHALFHTYLALPSATAKAIGLKGIGYKDKVAGKFVSSNDEEQQGWEQEIDRVYQGKAPTLHISANDQSNTEITLERSQTLPDTTLWNPGQAADQDMGDLHNGGWRQFVCAEPGHVSSFASLDKGKEWSGTQKLTFVTSEGKGSSDNGAQSAKTGAAVGESAAGGAAAVAGGAGAAAAATASQGDSSNNDKESAAASVIQRQYRSYVKDREAKGMCLSANARWTDAVGRARIEGAQKDAMEGGKNDTTSRWKRGGLLVGQLAGSPHTQLDNSFTKPVEGGPSLEPSPSLDGEHPSREESKGVIGNVPGANDAGKIDNIRSIAGKNDHGLKLVERWTRGAPAQELSKVMEAQYWLEMVDRKHRYGSNLKHYHAAWSNDESTRENFFKWLDEGAGKDLDLRECPREQLEKEQVTYLSSEQRANYIVDVKDGRLVWRRNGKYVDTTSGRWRDLDHGRGIVELGEEEKAEVRKEREERAARRGKKLKDGASSSSSSSSSSDDEDEPIDSEEEESEKQRARHYGGDQPKHKRGLRAFTPAGTWDKLLRKTVRNNTWIYVYNSRHELFVGIKTTGKFQHSSFLYGGRVLSAGLLKVHDGYLTSLSPLSGHYRAGSAHFRFFVASLQDSGVDLSNVTLSKSLIMLHGLEQYGKLSKKLKHQSITSKKKEMTEKGQEQESTKDSQDASKGDKAKANDDGQNKSKAGDTSMTSKLHRMSLHNVLRSKTNTNTDN